MWALHPTWNGKRTPEIVDYNMPKKLDWDSGKFWFPFSPGGNKAGFNQLLRHFSMHNGSGLCTIQQIWDVTLIFPHLTLKYKCSVFICHADYSYDKTPECEGIPRLVFLLWRVGDFLNCCGRKAVHPKSRLHHCSPHPMYLCGAEATGRHVNNGNDNDIVGNIQLVARNLSTHGQDPNSDGMCNPPFTLHTHICIAYMHYYITHTPLAATSHTGTRPAA